MARIGSGTETGPTLPQFWLVSPLTRPSALKGCDRSPFVYTINDSHEGSLISNVKLGWYTRACDRELSTRLSKEHATVQRIGIGLGLDHGATVKR